MTGGGKRPGVLRPGDRVRVEKVAWTIVGLSGVNVLMADERAVTRAVPLAQLLSMPGFEVLDGRSAPGRVLGDVGVVERAPGDLVERAEWWERHVLEVIVGVAPDAPVGARPRPGYDPAVTTVTSREAVKAAELTAGGFEVGASRVKRQRQRYQAGGLAALIDGRRVKAAPGLGRTDGRVVAAMVEAIGEATEASSRTAGYTLWRTGQILVERYGRDPLPVPVPSRATLYRLFAALSAGRHTAGSARTRRSLANRPDGPFHARTVAAPGELVQIDSTPLDVLVLLEDGVTGRVELTGMIDVATRSVTAAVLRPTTKAVDASVLLARTLTPEPMRPGWAEALRMSRSVLPHRRMLALDDRLEKAAAAPVIVPDTIVFDQGSVFVSRTFKASCAALGITYQPAHPGSPTERPQIERLMGSVATLFAQFVAGYTGSHPDRRGRGIEHEALWSLPELQELLDEWIVLWHNRPHEGLRDPLAPGRVFTPNEKYATLLDSCGYIPIALGPEDYVQLLPACWRAINAYGIAIGRRTYDAAELNPYRRQPSGIAGRKNLWEVRSDPYDISRVWVRDHLHGRWITVFWTHLRRDAAPFGELAWDHVRAKLPQATEQEMADAVQDLLERAHQGPKTTASAKRDRRVAARTRVTTEPTWPRPPSPEPQEGPDADTGPELIGEGKTAEVIPLGIFDAYQEAEKRW